MKNPILILLFCLNHVISYSQYTKGYYNKHFFISIEGLINRPIFYNGLKSNTRSSMYNKNLEEKNDQINTGFRLSTSWIVKNNFAIGCEVGFDYSDIYLKKSTSFFMEPDYNEIWIDEMHISKIAVRNFTILPKIQFSSKNSLIPMGFTHELGFGFTQSHIVEKDYAFDETSFITNDTTGTVTASYIKDHLFNYDVYPVKTYTLLYGFSMRNPISKYLFFNYGFRYTLNFKTILEGFFRPRRYESDFIYANGKIDELIENQRFLNFVNFSAGFTYVF